MRHVGPEDPAVAWVRHLRVRGRLSRRLILSAPRAAPRRLQPQPHRAAARAPPTP